MKRNVSVGKAVVAVLLAVLITAGATAALLGYFSPLGQIYQKLRQVEGLIDSSYLEVQDLSEQSLQDSAVAGYVAGLADPYAAYYTIEDYQSKKQSEEGILVGIGVEIYMDQDGSMVVHTVFDDSPAQEAGLQAEDRIIAVDGQSLATCTYEEAIGLVRGKEGSTVSVTILRDKEELVFTMVRRAVVMPAVTLTMMDQIAYVAIDSFTEETLPQLEQALASLQEQDASGIVFDLRDNGGGLLNAVIDVLDVLLPEGVLVTTVDANGNEEVKGESDASCVTLPMVCLINQYTASAAELFVAALRDFDYTQIVGHNSYGKGVMQNTYALSDGSAVKITTAYFNPPSGENFNGVGIAPEFEVLLSDEEKENFEKGNPSADPQLAKALELLS